MAVNSAFDDKVKLQKHFDNWKNSVSSATFLVVGLAVIAIVIAVIGAIMLVVGCAMISEANTLNEIEKSGKILKISAFIMAVGFCTMPLRNILCASSLKTWAIYNKVDLVKDLYGNKFNLKGEKFVWLSMATDRDNTCSLSKQYILVNVFKALGKVLFEIPFLFAIAKITESKFILSNTFNSSPDIFDILIDECIVLIIIAVISVVFDIVGMVMASSLRKKCDFCVEKQAKKLGCKPNYILSYNHQPKTQNTATVVSQPQNQSAKPVQSNIGTSLETKIEELKQLKEKGMITDEQYEEAVQKHLNSL